MSILCDQKQEFELYCSTEPSAKGKNKQVVQF